MNVHRRNVFTWILIGGGGLLLLAAILLVFLNRQPQPVSTATPALVEQVERVSLDDAKAAFDSGAVVFLDVRASSSYEASHIIGAVSIPLNDLPTRMGELDPASWIIPY